MVSQSAMGVDSQVRLCPLCQALGRAGVLVLRQINIEEAIYVCSDNQCFYPIAVGSTETELIKRHITEWDEAEVTEQRLANNTSAPNVPNFAGHPATAPTWQYSDPNHPSHAHRTTDFSHQLPYDPNCLPNGHHQPHGPNHPPYDQTSTQCSQSYTYDSTSGHYGDFSHQSYSQTYQSHGHLISQPHGNFGDFSTQYEFSGRVADKYGWPGYPPNGQNCQADAHLSYPGNQPDGVQQVDEMDSFIDSLFQS